MTSMGTDAGSMVSARTLVAAQMERNRQWTIVLMVVAAVNGAVVAILFGGRGGSMVLPILGLMAASVAGVYFLYPRLMTQVSGLREPSGAELAALGPSIDGMAGRFDVPTPVIRVLDDPAANAFAFTSADGQAAVVFTTGLLGRLSHEQLEAVAAHELAHVANGDTRVSLLSASFLGWALAVSWVGSTIAVALVGVGAALMASRDSRGDLASTVAMLLAGLLIMLCAALAWVGLQAWFLIARVADLAVHRQREYLADASAAAALGRTDTLIGALQELQAGSVALAKGGQLAQPLCIVGLQRTGRVWEDLVRAHPATEARIDRLRSFDLSAAVLAAEATLARSAPTSAQEAAAGSAPATLPGAAEEAGMLLLAAQQTDRPTGRDLAVRGRVLPNGGPGAGAQAWGAAQPPPSIAAAAIDPDPLLTEMADAMADGRCEDAIAAADDLVRRLVARPDLASIRASTAALSAKADALEALGRTSEQARVLDRLITYLSANREEDLEVARRSAEVRLDAVRKLLTASGDGAGH